MKRYTPIQINWKPDKTNRIPMYQQIVDFVLSKISSGEWSIGTQLPSQRKLAEDFGVNRSTITTAIDELTSYGIVEGRKSAGTRVISNTWSLMLPTSPDWGKYVGSGFFQSNNETIQAINYLEFKEDMIRLGTGEIDPRLFPAKMFENIMRRLSSRIKTMGYVEPLGMIQLRESLSARLKSKGIDIPPSCILITSGALQALHLIAACLLKPGTTVYTEAPTYLKSLQVFQSTGMKFTGIPMTKEGIIYKEIERSLNSRKYNKDSVLYTIPTNHNPTGITMPLENRKRLIKFSNDNQLPIIEDCAYEDLYFEGTPPKSLKELDKNNGVIYLGTASKSLAPGLRIGWLVAPESIVQRLGDIKMQMDYGASSLSQLVFNEFLVSGKYDEYIDSLKKEQMIRRNHGLSVLEKNFSDIATWNRPDGGFYIWLTFNKPVNMDNLFKEAVKKNVLLNPGDIYDFKENNSLRLSYSYTSPDEFEKAIETLRQLII